MTIDLDAPTMFRMDHDASRWDRRAITLHREVKPRLSKVAVHGFTEVAGWTRRLALHRLLKKHGYRLLQKGPGPYRETALGVDGSVYDILRWNSIKIGPDLGPGDIVMMTVSVLRNRKTGKIIIVSDAHLPASVEGNWDGERAKAYRKCVQRYRRVINAYIQRYQPHAVIVWADWNLNLHRDWVREYFEEAWPELHIPYYAIPRHVGTHAGKRFIDFPLIVGFSRGTVLITVLPNDKASDHDITRFRGIIPAHQRRMTGQTQ